MLFIATAILGWLVPCILLFVSLMASTIFVGAAISVLDGLMNPQAGAGHAPSAQQ
ncbi:MAG: hypothetical protein KGR26_02175 [Cyanobacteria bacterium REEB65]|nr:hypothetical protein [Cyanobacteria bacterium REEB65]